MKNVFKNIKKLSLCVLILVATFVFTTDTAFAVSAPKNVKISRTKVMDSYIGNNNGFTAFQAEDGIVYCMDIDKKGAESGMIYNYLAEGDKGLLYIIKNGYPNKSITGVGERDQYITQSAIWWYLDDINGVNKLNPAFKATDAEAYSGMRNEIIKLVNLGKAHRNDKSATPSMTLNSDGKIGLTSDKKNYESSYVSVSLVAATTYKVEVTGAPNAKVINESEAIQNQYNSGQKFKIRIPKGDINSKTTITVKVIAVGGTESVATFGPNNAEFQRVVSAKIYTKDTNLEKTTTFVINPTSNPICEIRNNVYYGKKGNVVDKKTFERECGPEEKVTCEVRDNVYYGKNGNVIDKDTFEKECSEAKEVIVPNTGANAPLLAVIGGIVVIAAGAGLIIYRKRQNN